MTNDCSTYEYKQLITSSTVTQIKM